MKQITWLAGIALAGLIACSSDENPGTDDNSSGGNTSGGSSGEVTSSSSGGSSGTTPSGSSGTTSGSSSGDADQCSAARTEALQEQTTVSNGVVSIATGTAGAEYLLYVDASAGGSGPSATQPRVYVDLATGARVDVSDVDARTSDAWDLAFKRTNAHTNGGVGGSGQAGAQVVAKAFADVTAADATALETEAFFDDECQLLKKVYADGQEDPYTFRSTLSDWYDYDTSGASHGIAPKDHSYVVRGGKGALYKLRFENYYGTPTGAEGETSGRFLIRVAPL